MTKDEIEKKRDRDFLQLLDKTKEITNAWEIYQLGGIKTLSDQVIAEKIYEENFLMSSILDAFTFRESLNLKEIFMIVLSEKVPNYFFEKVSHQRINAIIINMIKLGYIEPEREEETIVPILHLTTSGLKILQERTLQNLAMTSFYSYQSYNLNKKTIILSVTAIVISIVAMIISILIS